MVTYPLRRMKNTYLSTPVVFGMDLFLCVLASILVIIPTDIFLGHLEVFPFPEPRLKFGYYATSVVCSLIALLLIRIDRIVIRHMSVQDLVTLMGVALVKAGLMFVVGLALRRISGTVVLILVLDVLMTLFLLIAARVLMILVWEHFNQRIQERYEHRRMVIYGTSEKGVAAVAQLHHSPHFEVVGFLGEGGSGRTIEGLPVFGAQGTEEQEKILTRNRIDAVLFPTERPEFLHRTRKDSVGAFLAGEIGFTELSPIVAETLGKLDVYWNVNEGTASAAASEAKRICRGLIDKKKRM